ncbi:U-box domain-containing protein 44-like [Oryza brachyantha]|uniref:RING-type E3 ubiquitin transferase n=1 Tax=Oryza brachyantha TaxID=4533 RepID=J3NCL3_ORYBR|nr:U-box domain-containing protein 44-like [Oryza brachyantha]
MAQHRQGSQAWRDWCDGEGSDDDDDDGEEGVGGVLSAFVCPITMEVMRDPVVVETGHAFEREAIARWFSACVEDGARPRCPVTMEPVDGADLKPVMALRAAIEEWTDRRDSAELRGACRWLTKAASEKEALRGLDRVMRGWSGARVGKRVVRRDGMVPMVAAMLRSGSARVRLRALQALREFAREGDEYRESVSDGDTIRTIVKFIDHEDCQERDLAVSVLCELSKSELVCERISDLNGAILILGKVACSKAQNPALAEEAEMTLENLERCEKNVLQMAENGRLEPLLNLLSEGSPERQLRIASSLEKIVLSNDLKNLVAQRVGLLFAGVVENGTLQAKEVAFKVLDHISSNTESAKVLIEDGILLPLFRVLSVDGVKFLPPRLQEAAAAVLSNLVACGVDFGTVPLDDNRTIVSEDIVHSLLHLISNTSPPIQCKLLEIFVVLSSSTTTVLSITSAIRSSGAITNLVQFVESDHQESRAASIKLLCKISFAMDHEIAQVLRSSPTLLGCLVRIISDNDADADEQDAALQVLANLPKRDRRLTMELMEQGAFKYVARRVLSICRRGVTSNAFDSTMLEGLVKVLARITYILREEPRCVALSREYNLASLFTSLLRLNGLDGVQVLSAKALVNLSVESRYMTGTPNFDEHDQKSVLTWFGKKQPGIQLCRVHSGICSIRDNFCILEGKAVERLVACLSHQNKKVAEASLAALCTILGDGVEIAEGVSVLSRANAIEPIFEILKGNPTGTLQQRATWAVERILRAENIAKAASGDRGLSSALVHAFQNGDTKTRRIAEAALKHINKLPTFSQIIDRHPSRRGSSIGSMERYFRSDR